MPYLAIDTTSVTVTVSLGSPADVLAAAQIPQRTASEKLLDTIRQCLLKGGCELHDIEGLVVAAGPGSFTGIRIGLATAMGLHQATGVRSTAVSTLQVLAASSQALPGQTVLSVVDGLRGQWYAELYRVRKDQLPESLAVPTFYSKEGVLAIKSDCVISLDSASLTAETPGAKVAGALDSRVFGQPDSIASAMLGLVELSDFAWDSAALARPFYLRRPNISQKKKKKKAAEPFQT